MTAENHSGRINVQVEARFYLNPEIKFLLDQVQGQAIAPENDKEDQVGCQALLMIFKLKTRNQRP